MSEETSFMVRNEMESAGRGGSEAFNQILFENAPDAYYLSDTRGRLIDGNIAAEALVGYSKHELIGRSFLELDILPKDQFLKTIGLLAKSALRKPTGPDEIQLKRKDGTRIYAEIRTFPIIIRGRTVVLGIARDVTERRRAFELLEENRDNMRRSRDALVEALSRVIEMRDPATAGHQRRVADLAVAIAGDINMPPDRVEAIRIAGLIHDIGKIAVPSEILNKPGRLDEEETRFIREHPNTGFEILRNLDGFETIARIIHQHHERIDGSGYPRGLLGTEILLEARILAVADTVEAMASHRPYRSAQGIDAALREIEKSKGVLYDFEVASACLRVIREKGFAFDDPAPVKA